MGRATRFLTIVGMGLLTGATIGMGPVQAAPATGQATTTVASTSSAAKPQARWGNNEVVGYYRTLRNCTLAGRVGDRYNAWDDFDCERVYRGARRGAWALVVDQNNWNGSWNNRWRPGFWPRNWSNRPQWAGHGHFNHNHRGHGGDGNGHGHGHGHR